MADVTLRLNLIEGQVSQGLERIQDRLKELEDQLGKLDKNGGKPFKKTNASTGILSKSLGALGGAAKIAFGAVAVGSGIAAGRAVNLAKNYEQLNVSFTTFLGSAEEAEKVLAQLDQFSLATPFTPTQVQQAGKALLAFGIEADKLQPSLKAIGDIASGTGKDFNELAIIYGKARTAGTLFAEDINQLTEAGVPIIKEFAEQFGVTEAEVKKLGSEGKISFANLEKAFVDLSSEGGLFFNLMEEQSKTFGGQLSTLQGYFDNLLRELGKAFLPVLTEVVAAVSEFVEGLRAERILAFFQPISDNLIPALNDLYETLRLSYQNLFGFTSQSENLSGVVNALSIGLNNAVDGLKLFSDILTTLVGLFQRAIDGVNDFIDDSAFLTFVIADIKRQINGLVSIYKDLRKFFGEAAESQREYQEELSLTNELEKEGLLDRINNGEISRNEAIKELKLRKEVREFVKNANGEDELFIASKLKLNQITYQQAAQEIKQLKERIKLEEEEAAKVKVTGEQKVTFSTKSQKEIDKEIKKLKELNKTLNSLNEDLADLGEEARFEGLSDKEKAFFEFNKSRQEIIKLKNDIISLSEQLDRPLPTTFIRDFEDAIGSIQKKLFLDVFGITDKDIEEINNRQKVFFENFQKKITEQSREQAEKALAAQRTRSPIRVALMRLLRLDDEEYDQLLKDTEQQLNFAFDSVFEAFNSATQAQLSQQDVLIDKIDERIAKQQELVNAEKAIAEEGFANNLAIEQERLNTLEEERKKAAERRLEIEKNAANRQLAIDAALQASTLTKSAIEIFGSGAKLGLPGILFAVGAVATLFSLVARAKAQAAQFAKPTELRHGGLFEGANLLTHKDQNRKGRYHRIEGTNMAIEKGEWIIGTSHSKEHSKFLSELNNGKYKGVDIASNLELARSLSRRRNSLRISSDSQYMKDIMNKASKYDLIEKKLDSVINAINQVQDEVRKKPTVIPSGKNQLIINDGLRVDKKIVEVK